MEQSLTERYVFQEVNLAHKVYDGNQGLKRAIKELKELNVKYDRLPKYEDKDVRGIVGAIQSKKWIDYEIKTWNDLLEYVFGEVTTRRRKKEYYMGQEGLERITNRLREFKEKNGRLPKTSDKGMANIRRLIKQGIWHEQGIRTWNDLIFKIFGKVTRRV